MTGFKFIEKKNLWLCISISIIAVGFILMGMRSFQSKPVLNYGIDFIGGNTFFLRLPEEAKNKTNTIKSVRETLKTFQLDSSQIQFSKDNQILIKTISLEKNRTQQIIDALKTPLGQFEILEIDYIGPSIGKSLRKQSLFIILFITLSLLTYITLRFQLNFGLAALLALLHDGLVIFSITSILYLEINTAFIAALLTILGYSINDTIVIFDRIRENLDKLKNSQPLKDICNIALNQTLVRTINTSLTTLFVILALIIFGGSTIKEFCVILLVGIFSGTYSSLCIASPLLVSLDKPND